MLNINMTMGEAIQSVAEEHPDLQVLVSGETRLSHRQLLGRIDALAGGLAGLGIRHGDKIVTLLPPGPEFVYLFYAAARLGAVIAPLNPEIRPRTLGEVLSDARPQALVTARPVEGELLRQAGGSLRYIIFAGAEEEMRAGKVGADRVPGFSPPLESGEGPGERVGVEFCTLASLLQSGALPRPPVSVAPADLMALLYTSGTTGKPKATMHTHRSLLSAVVATIKVRELWMRPSSLRTVLEVARALARYRARLMRSIGRPQTFLSTVGWQTITGVHLMLQGTLMGDRLVVLAQFHPQKALELVQTERVTVLIAVPAAFQAMLALPDFDRYDTSSLLVCGTGTAPCPPVLGHEIQRRFKCGLYIGFGMTEAAGGVAVSSLADSDEQQAETVGRPLPGVNIRIVDDQRRDLPQGQVGELAVRSEGVMQGYYQAPELTAQVIDADGWYYTGDLVVLDEKGYLRVVGRKKDLIIRGGQNIYPAEIESYLETHPRIREAAVVGVPAVIGEESVWAFIRLKEGAQMTAVEVLNYCRGTLEPYKIPSQVRFLDRFPEAETGKPQKYVLRTMAMNERKGG